MILYTYIGLCLPLKFYIKKNYYITITLVKIIIYKIERYIFQKYYIFFRYISHVWWWVSLESLFPPHVTFDEQDRNSKTAEAKKEVVCRA